MGGEGGGGIIIRRRRKRKLNIQNWLDRQWPAKYGLDGRSFHHWFDVLFILFFASFPAYTYVYSFSSLPTASWNSPAHNLVRNYGKHHPRADSLMGVRWWMNGMINWLMGLIEVDDEENWWFTVDRSLFTTSPRLGSRSVPAPDPFSLSILLNPARPEGGRWDEEEEEAKEEAREVAEGRDFPCTVSFFFFSLFQANYRHILRSPRLLLQRFTVRNAMRAIAIAIAIVIAVAVPAAITPPPLTLTLFNG